jgi:hypothetical protein
LTNATAYEYDVALSFAGENRDYVEAVAKRLDGAGLTVFYDDFEQVNLWGQDLVVHLDEVYRTKARYCVIFISRFYRDKAWTTHELRSALARAVEERRAYLLPARFDDTEIPGVRPTIHYIDLRQLTPDQFAERVLQKLAVSVDPGIDRTASVRRVPKVAQNSFNPYVEAKRLIEVLVKGLRERCAAEASRGLDFTEFEREGRTCIRVLHHGRTRYALDVWMGGFTGDASIAFAYQRGEPHFSSGSMNAWGTVRWSSTRDEPVLPFVGFMGSGHQEKEYTYQELLDVFWNEVCDAVEGERW